MQKINHLDNKIRKWFAIYTRPRAEKKVYEQLQEIGIETYLPLKKELKQWKDRKKWVETPLFTSYIFVRVKFKEYYEIPKNIRGFVKYITIGGNRIAVRDKEIDTIKKMLQYSTNIEVSNETYKLNEEVEIKTGLMKGLKGKLINFSGNHKIAIKIETIGSMLIVKINKNEVRKTSKQ